jgi:hypothetical protein
MTESDGLAFDAWLHAEAAAELQAAVEAGKHQDAAQEADMHGIRRAYEAVVTIRSERYRLLRRVLDKFRSMR